MDAMDERILRYCKGGYKSLRPLFEEREIPMSTGYNRANRLVDLGLLERDKGKGYKTTGAGELELEREKSLESGWDALEEIYSPLKYAPTPTHRAIIELVMAAVIARKYEVKPNHHPSFIVFGGTLRWKTWMARFICIMLGLDPTKSIIITSSESGRSILTRKGYGGETVSKREILDQPFVCFDEFQEAGSTTRKLCNLYIQGEKRVSYENETLVLNPVAMILLNPKESGGLSRRIGFKEPQLRRSILCDLDKIEIPQGVRTRGDEFLEMAKKVGAIELPRYKSDCSRYIREIDRLVQNSVRKEKLGLVDIEMLALLCSGMTAFLPEQQAVNQVIRDYLICIETLGWTKEDWPRVLASSIFWGKEKGIRKEGRLTLREEVKRLIGDKTSEFDYGAKLDEIKEVLQSLNLSPVRASELLKLLARIRKLGLDESTAVRLAEEIKKQGWGEDAAREIVRCIQEYGSLTESLSKKREELERLEEKVNSWRKQISELSPKEVQKLSYLEKSLESLGIGLDNLERSLKEENILEKKLSRLKKEVKERNKEVERLRNLQREIEEDVEGMEKVREIRKMREIRYYCLRCGHLNRGRITRAACEGALRNNTAITFSCKWCGAYNPFNPWNIVADIALMILS
jgi:cell division protein FtsB